MEVNKKQMFTIFQLCQRDTYRGTTSLLSVVTWEHHRNREKENKDVNKCTQFIQHYMHHIVCVPTTVNDIEPSMTQSTAVLCVLFPLPAPETLSSLTVVEYVKLLKSMLEICLEVPSFLISSESHHLYNFCHLQIVESDMTWGEWLRCKITHRIDSNSGQSYYSMSLGYMLSLVLWQIVRGSNRFDWQVNDRNHSWCCSPAYWLYIHKISQKHLTKDQL